MRYFLSEHSGLSYAGRLRVVLLLMVSGLLLLNCSEKAEDTDGLRREDTADRIMHNAEIEFSQEGRPTGKIKAKKMLFFDKEHRTFAYDLTIDFYNTDGSESGQLTADSGWVENKTRRVNVYGDVHLYLDDGTEVWAESLAYYPSVDRVRTGSKVRIERGKEYITGVGMDSDLNFTDIRIEQNVSGRLREN